MEFAQRFAHKERERKEALTRQDALRYYQVSTELGMDINRVEDRELYEKGLGEEMYVFSMHEIANASATREEHSRTRDATHYALFLQEAEQCNIRSYAAHEEYKRSLLVKYFPGRFGRDGSQPLSRYDAGQVGRLFENVLATAHCKSREKPSLE